VNYNGSSTGKYHPKPVTYNRSRKTIYKSTTQKINQSLWKTHHRPSPSINKEKTND